MTLPQLTQPNSKLSSVVIMLKCLSLHSASTLLSVKLELTHSRLTVKYKQTESTHIVRDRSRGAVGMTNPPPSYSHSFSLSIHAFPPCIILISRFSCRTRIFQTFLLFTPGSWKRNVEFYIAVNEF